MSIGNRIKTIRGELSRPEFAKRLGISKTAVQSYETLDHIPKGDVLLKIKQEFGVSTDWLLTGEGDMELYKKEGAGNVIPMDPAVQMLREVEQETGVKLNHRQREAVIEILREELEKDDLRSKEKYSKLLKSLGKSEDE